VFAVEEFLQSRKMPEASSTSAFFKGIVRRLQSYVVPGSERAGDKGIIPEFLGRLVACA
jgi:hypothetical protein